MMRILVIGLMVALIGGTAQATENLALIIANKDYRNYADARDGFVATSLNAQLVAAGFDVRVIRNLNQKGLQKLAPVIRQEIGQAERVLVFVSGHVFSDGRESWLMATDTPRLDGLSVGAWGLPLGALVDLLGEKAGAAVLMVGNSGTTQPVGKGLSYGYVPRDIAQGVTVFSGRTSKLVTVVEQSLLTPGTGTVDAASLAPRGVEAFGFLSSTVAFRPILATPQVIDDANAISELEQLIWDNAKAGASEQSILSYLDRFPDGAFAQDASDMLASLRKSPAELARDGEQALELGREARRDIQRDLSLLGYDTRGIDGIFGRGTRAAVTAWQSKSGMAATGYLSGNQIIALEADAAVRAVQLEEEARARRAEQDRQDAIFWRAAGRGGDEAGLRAYIKKYPDGLYSEIALDRLQVFDEERRRSAQIAERNAWDVANELASAQGYTEFLKNYPDGEFARNAQEQLAALQASDANAAAKAEERRVLGNPITRILVEQKLAALGFKPGKVDGRIDDKTRKAVRKFQRAADLAASGYVTQATIVRLLAAR